MLYSTACEGEPGELLHAAVFWSRTKDWEIRKQELHPSLTSCCGSSLYLALNSQGKKKETGLGFSHLKSIVTPQHFSVLLFAFFFKMSYCKWLVYTVQVTLVAV